MALVPENRKFSEEDLKKRAKNIRKYTSMIIKAIEDAHKKAGKSKLVFK